MKLLHGRIYLPGTILGVDYLQSVGWDASKEISVRLSSLAASDRSKLKRISPRCRLLRNIPSRPLSRAYLGTIA